jgi:hypothetical protein
MLLQIELECIGENLGLPREFGKCHNPTLKECEDDSHFQKLKVQLQGPKHFALRCSLYHWKGLEV